MYFDFDTRSFLQCAVLPDAPAVIAHDRSLSWTELEAAVLVWCEKARSLGFGPDTPVVLSGHKESQFMVALVGAMVLGAPFVPVDSVYPEQRLQSILKTLNASVLYDAGLQKFVVFHAAPPTVLEEKNLGYVMFTSGTTGEPKGVQIGWESVQGLIEWMRLDFDLGLNPVFLNHTVFSFDVSLYDVFGALSMGGTILMLDRERAGSALQVAELIRQHEVTTWVSTPSFAQQQLLNPGFVREALPSLRTFLFCGEPLPVPLARSLRQRFPDVSILNTYGPTEATVATTLLKVEEKYLRADALMPIGRAKRDSAVYCEEGELCIAGPHVMRGYLHRPELNSARMFVRNGQRGFKTGDLGEEDPTGLLYCKGRMDDQIKLNGYRLELLEVDAALASLPGFRAAATVALRRSSGAVGRLIAFVETGTPDTSLPAELAGWRALLAERLPPYMLPTELLTCERMPVSINHKIDRNELARQYNALSA